MQRSRSSLILLALVGLLLATLAVPLVTQAAPDCGICTDGTFNNQDLTCGGAAADCSECTVCIPGKQGR